MYTEIIGIPGPDPWVLPCEFHINAMRLCLEQILLFPSGRPVGLPTVVMINSTEAIDLLELRTIFSQLCEDKNISLYHGTIHNRTMFFRTGGKTNYEFWISFFNAAEHDHRVLRFYQPTLLLVVEQPPRPDKVPEIIKLHCQKIYLESAILHYDLEESSWLSPHGKTILLRPISGGGD